jgi:hypothetical protein
VAAVPTPPTAVRRSLPAATAALTAVYLAGAAVALVLGGPAERLLGLAVAAITAARLVLLRAPAKGAA